MAKQPAMRTKVPLRMLLDGYEGSGKTFTAMKVMRYLVGDAPMGVIDTERNRALLYAPLPDKKADAEKGTFEFWHYPLADNAPATFIAAIRDALNDGVAGLIVDSITHEWDGDKGILDQKTELDKSGANKGNSYINWGVMTDKHNEFLNVLLNLPVPLIATGRVHQDHVIENVNGKNVVKKAGLNLIQRDTTGYEFDFIGRMELGGVMTITKCPNLEQIQDKVIVKPGLEFAAFLNGWLGLGAAMPMSKDQYRSAMQALGYGTDAEIAEFGKQHPDITGIYRLNELLKVAQG